MKTYKENDEVLYPAQDIFTLEPNDLVDLKQAALKNRRQRIRLCAHRNPEDSLHEMFIIQPMSAMFVPYGTHQCQDSKRVNSRSNVAE